MWEWGGETRDTAASPGNDEDSLLGGGNALFQGPGGVRNKSQGQQPQVILEAFHILTLPQREDQAPLSKQAPPWEAK